MAPRAAEVGGGVVAPRTVVFACIHNAGRSQMAAGWLEVLGRASGVTALSAGTAPASQVYPEVVEVMREVGIDLRHRRPQLLSPALVERATHLITMGCGEVCSAVPAHVARSDWPLPDPKGQSLAAVRQLRDVIRGHVERLLASFRAPTSSTGVRRRR